MDTIILAIAILIAISMIGFIFALILILSAKKQVSDQTMFSKTENKKLEKQNTLVIIAICATGLVFGIVQSMLILIKSGALDGNIISDSLPTNLIIICLICATLNFISSVGKGYSASKSIKKNMIKTAENFQKVIIPMSIVESLAVISLVIFMLLVFQYNV